MATDDVSQAPQPIVPAAPPQDSQLPPPDAPPGMVNVVDPSAGITKRISSDDLDGALSLGYHVEQPHEEALRLTKGVIQKNPWSSAFATFANQTLNQATLGVSGAAEDTANKQDSPYELAKTVSAQEHPVINALGGLTGTGIALLYGGPIWKGLGWAGDAASDTAMQVAKAAGVDAANSYVAKAASLAAKYGTEGAAVSLPRAITPPIADVALGNPDDVGQHLVAAAGNVAAGAAMGVGVGLAAGPVSAVLNAVGDRIDSESITDLANRFKVKGLDIYTAGFNKIQKLNPNVSLEDNIQKVVDFADSKELALTPLMNPLDRASRVYEYKGELGQALNQLRSTADGLAPEGEAIDQTVLSPIKNLANKYSDDPKSLEDIEGQIGQIKKSMGQVVYNRFDTAARETLGLKVSEPLPQGLVPVMYDAEGKQVLGADGIPIPLAKSGDGSFLVSDDTPLTHVERAQIKTSQLHDLTYPAPDPTRPWYRPNPSSPGAADAYSLYENATENSLDKLVTSSGDANLKSQYTDIKDKIAPIYKMQDIFNAAARQYAGRNQISLGDSIAATAGSVLDGGTGAVVGGITNYLKRRYGNQLMANVLYKAADGIDALHGEAFSSLSDAITGVAPEAGRAVLPASINALGQWFADNPNAPKSKADQIAAIGQQVAKYSSDPNTAVQLNQAVTGGFTNMMPQTAASMSATITNAINYLGKNTPIPTTQSTPLNPVRFTPTDRQVSQFERKLATIMDPNSALKDIASGALTKDQVDVLQNVYPSYFRAIQSQAGKILAQVPSIPSKTKASLNLLMGASVTDKQGSQIQLLQENFMQQDAPVTPGRNSKINAAGRAGISK